MPSEEEMVPRDKYTIFDRKEKRYRKGIHSELYPTPFSLLLGGVVKVECGRGQWEERRSSRADVECGRVAEVDKGVAEN